MRGGIHRKSQLVAWLRRRPVRLFRSMPIRFCLARAPFKFFFGNLDDRRQEGEKDNHYDDLVNMVMNIWHHLTEKVAAEHSRDYPTDAAGDVVDDEAFVLHRADPGDHGCECSEYRNEAGDHDGEGAVALVKFLRSDEMLAVK